jgi:adenosylcobalamin-dependent ribonucleoside-triphosphate reductase
MDRFRLSDNFIEQYKIKRPPFGFNGLGELVYYRTYSRLKLDGGSEVWWETCRRVVEGTYNMQKKHIEDHKLGWNAWKAQRSAQEMFDRMFHMKFLPPGRGLWAMGSPITEERGLFAALNNCGFVSSATLKDDLAKSFLFLMDMSMLGVGVGFDTLGAGQLVIKGPNKKRAVEKYVIPDTREGWVESVRMLIEAYFLGTAPVEFDYSQIRKEGSPIKGFGGVSAGEKPLIELHGNISSVLDKEVGSPISVRTIVDLHNFIGKTVVAGNVRRTAEIAFGDPADEEFLDLKNYTKNPEREKHGWTSNNSVFAKLGMNYKHLCDRIWHNGEPGVAWLENMRGYSRMNNGPDNKDHRVAGGNPCLEQSLESYELCCLVEVFPMNCTSFDDYLRTIKFAYLYAKTVTLGETHWAETNRVLLRNRRIGCSIGGVQQFLAKHSIGELKKWLEEGYDTIQHWDEIYSDWFAIPRSKKTTSEKPSGSISLVVGALPGMHWPKSRFYIRRVRLSKFSDLVPILEKAGYLVEPCFGSEDSTVVVEIPVDVGVGVRTLKEVSMWEQLLMAAFIQRYWADNQVSCTVEFEPETEGPQIAHALDYFQYMLKGISFLPKKKEVYRQMPYEEITEEQYNARFDKLKRINFVKSKDTEKDVEKFCDGDSCLLAAPIGNS